MLVGAVGRHAAQGDALGPGRVGHGPEGPRGFRPEGAAAVGPAQGLQLGGRTPAYAWLQAHCAEYGFILRYMEGKESITGYRFEPWHYRYVGAKARAASGRREPLP